MFLSLSAEFVRGAKCLPSLFLYPAYSDEFFENRHFDHESTKNFPLVNNHFPQLFHKNTN